MDWNSTHSALAVNTNLSRALSRLIFSWTLWGKKLRNLLKPQATLHVWSYWILLNWRLFPFDKRKAAIANKHCFLLSWKYSYCVSSWCLSVYEEIYGNLSCIIIDIDTWALHMKYIDVIFLQLLSEVFELIE